MDVSHANLFAVRCASDIEQSLSELNFREEEGNSCLVALIEKMLKPHHGGSDSFQGGGRDAASDARPLIARRVY